MIINGHNHCDSSEKMQRCQDYIQALEKERCKIQVFQRELPLCLELVTQAIETCKQQLSGTTSEYNSNGGQYECSEETSGDMPVLEEFMPIKRYSSHSDDEEKQKSKKTKNDTKKEGKFNGNDKNSKKSDWLRSVQLWNNQTPDPPSNSKQDSLRKVAVMEVKKSGKGGAFHPFKKLEKNGETSIDASTPERTVPPASASSTAETGGSSGTAGNKEEKDGQSQRKSRRCWSPELHRRFLQALQQLGGSHAATPKQIRELMKVDGLTNDEVKSHLQKYRLHTRRPSPSTHHTTTTTNAQAPQFLVVGGIWVPPEYTTMAAPGTTTTSREPSGVAQGNGIYAPIATLPSPFQGASNQRQLNKSSNSDDRGNHNEGHVQSHSPATSSSRHN